MKLIIPMAGKGTRLRPHTITTPKPLVELAGKPMLGHVLDRIKDLKIKEAVFIVDEEKPNLKKYLEKNYGFKVHFEVQKDRKGIAHALYQGKKYFNKEEVFILFADTLIEADFKKLHKTDGDGIIWTKEVEDPRKFGVVFLHDNYITKLIEKPEIPPTNKAIVGMYYLKDSSKLFSAIKNILDKQIMSKNEYQITDALQIMIEKGAKLRAGEVKMWKDCGNAQSLLEANQYLLKGLNVKTTPKTSVIIKPVNIEPGAQIKNSVIGPNVSVGKDSYIEGSVIKESIIGKDSEIKNTVLKDSIVGSHTKVKGNGRNINIGDYSEAHY